MCVPAIFMQLSQAEFPLIYRALAGFSHNHPSAWFWGCSLLLPDSLRGAALHDPRRDARAGEAC